MFIKTLISIVGCFWLLSTAIPCWAENTAGSSQTDSSTQTANVPCETTLRLAAGQIVELTARITSPSDLPANAHIRIHWTLVDAEDEDRIPRLDHERSDHRREPDIFNIYTSPTADWTKDLHALDPDVYVLYRAPLAGTYCFSAEPIQEVVQPRGKRWRETGAIAEDRLARIVQWPANAKVPVELSIKRLSDVNLSDNSLQFELEPNDTPEQANPLPVLTDDDISDRGLVIIGGADDVDYIDNLHVGVSGDDWFQIRYDGTQPRVLKASLSIVDQLVVGQIRCYRVTDGKELAPAEPGQLVGIEEYTEGKNPNERVHQQKEQHRVAINRNLEPGQTYLLRVEANAPGYELQLRAVPPAPYDSPARSIREGMYDHLGQVASWLLNRPRGASVERRIRETGNLLGTHCMSCHTQSGVWGPAIPMVQGYRPQNMQFWRILQNICYQSMRPCNELKDAANNTSLPTLDLGDGPAGTRVAGHAVVALERFQTPRKLHSKQAIRAANYILQSSDPGGINAAGPGANVGQGVVFNYAGEVLAAAYESTGDLRYFRGLEDKARKILTIEVKFADDLGHRVEFFRRYFPKDYVQQVGEISRKSGTFEEVLEEAGKARELQVKIDSQVDEDLQRLRAIQADDGSWSFDPGQKTADGKWEVKDTKPDPSPTALALIALQAAEVSLDDETVSRGIAALLKMQHPSGYWNGASKTGFVSTSYAMHALSRYYPTTVQEPALNELVGSPGQSLQQTIARVRKLSNQNDPRWEGLLIEAATHPSPLVRYWAYIGLGGTHGYAGVTALISGLGETAKFAREAAHWALRQTLIDNRGWEQVAHAARHGDDLTRAAAMRALVMRVDGVMPGITIGWDSLSQVLTHGMVADPNPEVRSWAMRAAWNWWVWNPPMRQQLNVAWTEALVREESDQLVEISLRYQAQALLIANGHIGNPSEKHRYPELAQLITSLTARLNEGPENARRRLANRLTAIAGTFYNTRGGDGGPGQMGYITAGSTDLFGRAVLTHFKHAEQVADRPLGNVLTRLSLEAAKNVSIESLQKKLVNYSLEGPPEFRQLASSSVSDSKLVTLIAVAEQLEPMYRQLLRGAQEPERRAQLSDPILTMFRSVRWNLPNTDEQRNNILQFLVPDTSGFQTAHSIAEEVDVERRAIAEQAADATWYLSQGLGTAVAKNDDLHFDNLAKVLPQEFANPAEAYYWLPNIPWILTLETAPPDVASVAKNEPPPFDPWEELRSRALRLFLSQLTAEADSRNQLLAIELANKTALRRNPEVLAALADILPLQTDEEVKEQIQKVLSQSRDSFLKDLTNDIQQHQPDLIVKDESGNATVADAHFNDILYFRDYVVPEMNRTIRQDDRSCLICHGEPGRVPSMELHAPDDVGFLPVNQLMANYRILQKRVNLTAWKDSKLLRKPLNVQSGKEDGHQGGRRYQPDDPGYQILRHWAQNQVELRSK